MPKVITASTFVLFWAFFEMSGGTDFVPPSEREENRMAKIAVAPQDDVFEVIPFDQPVIVDAASVIAPEEDNGTVIQAAFGDDPALQPASLSTEAALSEPQPQAALPRADIRNIIGNRVNLRDGPGTGYDVIDTYSRGAEAEVLKVNDDWAQIRLLETGDVGWMAAWLLSD